MSEQGLDLKSPELKANDLRYVTISFHQNSNSTSISHCLGENCYCCESWVYLLQVITIIPALTHSLT